MRRWQQVNRIPWLASAALLVAALGLAAWRWAPGLDVRDGRDDRGRNGIAIGMQWIADDAWFDRHQPPVDRARCRDPLFAGRFARALRENHVTELFIGIPAPDADGAIHGLDSERTEALLYECYDVRAWAAINATGMPLGDSRWRRFFVLNVRRLLDRHPRLRGLQIEARSVNDGDLTFVTLLDEIRATSTSDGRLLSIVIGDWKEPYLREIATRADQITIPLTIASPLSEMLGQSRRATRIGQTLASLENKSALLKIPSDRRLRSTLAAVHQALNGQPVPVSYGGVLLDSNGPPSADTWRDFRERFLKP